LIEAIRPAFRTVIPASKYNPACSEPKCSSAQTLEIRRKKASQVAHPDQRDASSRSAIG